MVAPVTKDESSQMKKSAMVAAEMEQQRINDSIAVVRREEAEKRRKDSIDALNEQARLATIRKLEEKELRNGGDFTQLENTEFEVLFHATNRFIDRFESIEQAVSARGLDVTEVDRDELERIWDENKKKSAAQ